MEGKRLKGIKGLTCRSLPSGGATLHKTIRVGRQSCTAPIPVNDGRLVGRRNQAELETRIALIVIHIAPPLAPNIVGVHGQAPAVSPVRAPTNRVFKIGADNGQLKRVQEECVVHELAIKQLDPNVPYSHRPRYRDSEWCYATRAVLFS